MSKLIPFTEALAMIGIGRTSGYKMIGGLVTEPIDVGHRNMLPEVEAESLKLARVAGFTLDEQRELVRQLMNARQELASDEQIAAIVKTLQAERLARGTTTAADRAERSAKARKLVARRLDRAPA